MKTETYNMNNELRDGKSLHTYDLTIKNIPSYRIAQKIWEYTEEIIEAENKYYPFIATPRYYKQMNLDNINQTDYYPPNK